MARLNVNNEQDRFVLRDYHHAAKTFTSEPGYEKLPYSGFLFHVNISFNNVVGASEINTKDIGVLIKAADLPETRFETETLNQYNRKRIINKRVLYQSINLEFHDDVANNVRNMWIAYNQYYSADSNYVDVNTWQLDNVYQIDPLSRNYGLDNGSTVPFINKIEIYSMGNHRYSKMLLVNPVITSAKFDDHEYSEGGKTMQTTLGIEYENIIYSTGTTDNIPGFGDDNVENYDQTPSSLGESSPFEVFGSASTLETRVDTPIVSSAATIGSVSRETAQQSAARQIDPVAGKVARNGVKLTENQYQQIKSTATVQDLARQRNFTFPETAIRTLTDVTLSSGISAFGDPVSRSTAILSNGNNISAATQPDVSDAPLSTAGSTVRTSEILVDPVVPEGLTAAEKVLFSASFPPLPSTDPRASQPPYV